MARRIQTTRAAVPLALLLLTGLGLLAGCGPGRGERLSFIAVGSTGTGGLGQRAVGQAMAASGRDHGLDHVLLLGDVFRRHGVVDTDDPQWETKFVGAYPADGLAVPFFAVAGNRDHRGSLAALLEFDRDDRWQMPATWYSFSRTLTGGTRAAFVGLDTHTLLQGERAARAQRRWLAQTLAQADADWLVVFGHDPVLRINGETDPALASLLPLLHRYGPDLYLSAEENVLALRTDTAGALHVASGAGAMVLDPPPAPTVAAFVPRQGFVHVQLDDRALALRIIDRDGIVRHALRGGGEGDRG